MNASERSVRLGACALAVVACLLVSVGFAQARAEAFGQNSERAPAVIPPPKEGLLPVHMPDASRAEADVREHLELVGRTLLDATRKSGVGDSALGEAYGEAARVFHAYSFPPPAEECYRNAKRLMPNDHRWPYLLGLLFRQEGRAEEAVGQFEEALKLRPDYLPALVNTGTLKLQRSEAKEARAIFSRALEVDERCTAARYGLGQVALSERDYPAAVKFLERALLEAPGANRIHYALGMAYRGMGETEKAREHLQKQGPVGVTVADPLADELKETVRGERLHLLRGRAAFNVRRFAEASAAFKKAVEANPVSVTARINLGSSLAEMGDEGAAVEQFKEAVRLEPENPTAHFNLGLLLSKRNEREDAARSFRAVLKSNPKDAQARSLLARELLLMGKTEEATTELARLVEASPDDESLLLDYVKLLMAGGEFARALEVLERAHARNPNNGLTVATLAYLLAASPRQEDRDGPRALKLATLVYEATGAVNYGVLVAMALAESGRCDEAAGWQRRMKERAESEGDATLASKLAAELERYEKGPPCRPVVSNATGDAP